MWVVFNEMFLKLKNKKIRVFVQDLFFASYAVYAPFAYFLYYSGIYFISLLALCRLLGLFNRYFFVIIDISTIIFIIGYCSYLLIIIFFLYIFIKETFFTKYDFTEEFFKEKALYILKFQKTNWTYKFVLYTLYIFDAQDFIINNVRFGRFVMSYYLLLCLYKKYGLKKCLLGIRKFHLDRDFYEKIRCEYTVGYKHLHLALLEIILEKLAVIPEGEDEYMSLEQTMHYWNNLIFLVAQGSIDSLKKEQVIVKDFNAMELFFEGFQEIEHKSVYGLRLQMAENNANVKKANFCNPSKFIMFPYFSTNLLYFSLLILWFTPQIKYLKMRDKNFFQLYWYKLMNINIQIKHFVAKNSLYVPDSNVLVKLNPHFNFFFKPGVTRTMFDLFASKKIDAGFVPLKISRIIYIRREWKEYFHVRPRRKRYRLLKEISKVRRRYLKSYRLKELSFKFSFVKPRYMYIKNKNLYHQKGNVYMMRTPVLRKAIVDNYVNKRILESLSILGIKSIKTHKDLEIAKRLIFEILKNLKTEDIYYYFNIHTRFGPAKRKQGGPLYDSYTQLASRKLDHKLYWFKLYGYKRRKTIKKHYTLNWVTGHTYVRNNNNFKDKKSLRADWITTELSNKLTSNGKSLGMPVEKATYSHALTNSPGDMEPEEWHNDQWVAVVFGSNDKFVIWYAILQMDRIDILKSQRKLNRARTEKYNIFSRPYDVYLWPSLLRSQRKEGGKKQWLMEQRKFIVKESMKQLASPIYHAIIRTRHSVGDTRYLERTRFLTAPELVTHDFVAVVPDPENPKQPWGDLDILYEYRHGFNTYDYDDASLSGYDFLPLGEEIWGYTGYHKSIDEMIHMYYKFLLGPGTPRDKCINLSGDYGLNGNIYIFLVLFKLYIVTFISLFLINKSFYKWVLKFFDWLVVLFIVVLSMLIKYSVSQRFVIFFVILQCFEPIFGDIGFITLLDFIATTCEINDGRFVD